MEPEGSLPHPQMPPPLPILNHIDQFHVLTPHFLKIHLNIILPSKPGSSKRSHSLSFPYQNPVYTSTLPSTCYMPHPPYFSRIGHPSNIWWGVQIIYISICKLTFRHRSFCMQDRRFATLQRTLFIYLINKYISLSDICLTVHHWYK